MRYRGSLVVFVVVVDDDASPLGRRLGGLGLRLVVGLVLMLGRGFVLRSRLGGVRVHRRRVVVEKDLVVVGVGGVVRGALLEAALFVRRGPQWLPLDFLNSSKVSHGCSVTSRRPSRSSASRAKLVLP